MNWQRIMGAGAGLLLLGCGAVAPVRVEAAEIHMPPRPQVTSPRIYMIDCGTLVIDTPELFGLTRDEVQGPIMSDMCFLVVHPKGTLLWDTGLTDRWVGRPLGENMSNKHVAQLKTNTLIGQLADIGYTPEMIDFISLSHSHYDHSGNSNVFARSATWLVSKPEWNLMFGSSTHERGYEDYWMLKEAKTVFVEDNHDVFGDGSVVIRRAPGHTPGHSVLTVRLKNAGNIILGGDLYHYPEEATLNRMPKAEENTGTRESRAMVAEMAKQLHAQVWIAHDTALSQRLRHEPAFIE